MNFNYRAIHPNALQIEEMKTASVKELKEEMLNYSAQDLMTICLRLAKFKKENKELLTYLLFEASDEMGYINGVKQEMDHQFEQINRKSFYFIKKSIRKILRLVKQRIRYSQNKETEVELLIYFCQKLKHFQPSIRRSTILQNLYQRQVDRTRKLLSKLHEDLQYDYES